MHSEAFKLGMWSGAGFEKIAAKIPVGDKNILAYLNKHLLRNLKGRKAFKTKGRTKAPVAPEAPGFFESLTPNRVGLGVGIPAGLLGYMAASGEPGIPPPPPINPMMMGMYGMPGGYNQIPTPPSAGTAL